MTSHDCRVPIQARAPLGQRARARQDQPRPARARHASRRVPRTAHRVPGRSRCTTPSSASPREGPSRIECDVAGVPLDRSQPGVARRRRAVAIAAAHGAAHRRAGPADEAHSAAGRARAAAAPMRRRRCWGWRRLWRVPITAVAADRRGGHAGRGRAVLPVGRHGPRARARRRGLSAGRPAAALDRPAGAGLRRVVRRRLPAGTTPSGTRRRGVRAADPQYVPGPVAVAGGPDGQRPGGADRPAPPRDRPDARGAAAGRRAGGGHDRQRLHRLRPVSDSGRTPSARWPSCPGAGGGCC